MRTYYSKLILDNIGMMKLKDIKAMHVQNFINGLFEKSLAHSTVLNIKCLLGDMMKKAVANEYMLRNSCDSVIMPKKPRLDTRFLKVKEQSIFLEAARDYYHYDIFEFCLTTGMRIGEALGIKWGDIDFENKTIQVNRTLHYSRKNDYELCHFFFTSPKTEGSVREVPLLEETERALKRCKKRQLANKMLFGNKWKEEEPFDNMVFTSKDGAPVRYADVNRTIKTVINKINIAEQQLAELESRNPVIMENFSPHCFRHTYVTRCRENKVPLEVVQSIVGHSNEEMTLYYDHNEVKMDTSSLRKFSFLNVV